MSHEEGLKTGDGGDPEAKIETGGGEEKHSERRSRKRDKEGAGLEESGGASVSRKKAKSKKKKSKRISSGALRLMSDLRTIEENCPEVRPAPSRRMSSCYDPSSPGPTLTRIMIMLTHHRDLVRVLSTTITYFLGKLLFSVLRELLGKAGFFPYPWSFQNRIPASLLLSDLRAKCSIQMSTRTARSVSTLFKTLGRLFTLSPRYFSPFNRS